MSQPIALNTSGVPNGNLAGDASGAALVKETNPQTPTGRNLYSPLLGSLVTKVALPSGAGKGPDTYIVDLAQFGASSIYLVALYTTGTVTHTADVKYSNDGQAGNAHPATADSLWAATAGNLQAAISKKDRFAHITIAQITGTAETVHYYVVGREIS